MSTPAGKVARISTQLRWNDHLGGCKARWGIGRMTYMVPPGLYAVGEPGPDTPVLVTANYKMSFDMVRAALSGRSAWLLVLETYGINVWCAAGKGTFGTGELVRRIAVSGLDKVVAHRRLVLPILGAPGISAPEVARRTGFSVCYATIRAVDIPAFLDNAMQATPAMRRLTFTLYERLVLIPVELVLALKSIAIVGSVALLAGLLFGSAGQGGVAFVGFAGAVATGIVMGPLLLPWLPGPGFALKGALVGLFWSVLFCELFGGAAWGWPVKAAALVALPAVSAFYTLNFTGCTPFTSRSGVKKEMRLALPVIFAALAAGAILLAAETFI